MTELADVLEARYQRLGAAMASMIGSAQVDLEMLDQRLEGVRHGGRGGRLRRGDAVSLANQFASLGVHQAALDPGAANIYSQHLHPNLPFIVPMANGRQSMKKVLSSGKDQITYA